VRTSCIPLLTEARILTRLHVVPHFQKERARHAIAQLRNDLNDGLFRAGDDRTTVLSGGGPFYGTGYYGSGGLGLVIVILLILLLLGRI
jgi:Protein of unknown function (DUF3309)